MPKRAAETYDSDGGFVEDVPKTKKTKATGKAGRPSVLQKDSGGGSYWEISGKRRLQISEFKGNTMVSIREFYEKDGQMLPGKKGISMNVDQFNAIIELLPEIENQLKEKNIELARPHYGTSVKAGSDEGAEEEPAREEEPVAREKEEAGPVAKTSKSKLSQFMHRSKKNHEATSDEDDD